MNEKRGALLRVPLLVRNSSAVPNSIAFGSRKTGTLIPSFRHACKHGGDFFSEVAFRELVCDG